jgi:hypothetical protein
VVTAHEEARRYDSPMAAETFSPPTPGVLSPWITIDDVIECCSSLPDPPNAKQLQLAVDFATGILFRLSGRQFPGLKERTLRPLYGSNAGCGGGSWLQWPMGSWAAYAWDQAAAGWSFPSVPYRVDGQWFNLGVCGDTCNVDRVELPGPVNEVLEVVIDGGVLASSAYAVETFEAVARRDGKRWPCTNNLAKDSYAGALDAQGTWQITYNFGRLPDAGGIIACTRLACEMSKFMCNAADCQLPQRVKHIVREGEDLDFADPLTFLNEGKVGIYEVDLWLMTINPAGLMRRSTIRRLDGPEQFRTFTDGEFHGP